MKRIDNLRRRPWTLLGIIVFSSLVSAYVGLRMKSNHLKDEPGTKEPSAVLKLIKQNSLRTLAFKSVLDSSVPPEGRVSESKNTKPREGNGEIDDDRDFTDLVGRTKKALSFDSSPSSVFARAKYVVDNYSRSEIKALADKYGKMPPELIPNNEEELIDFISGWIGAVTIKQESTGSSVLVTPLAFADHTDEFGRVLASTGVFRTGTERVYAVFQNGGEMAGRTHLLAVWRDLNTGEAIFQEIEKVLPEADSNYVWLHRDDGWPGGKWQVDLYDPEKRFSILASGMFEVKNN